MSSSNPMLYVLRFGNFFFANATIRLESRPPESKTPTSISEASSLLSIEFIRADSINSFASFSFVIISSRLGLSKFQYLTVDIFLS